MFSKFGRRIFALYEKRPMLMNTAAGAVVYAGGEVAVQVTTNVEQGVDVINWRRVGNIAALGSVGENILNSVRNVW
jgi:hypothetical protein